MLLFDIYKGDFMKKLLLALVITGGSLYQDLEARCHRRYSRGSSLFAGIVGAVAGAAVAASIDYPCYYRECPQYDFAYPAAPLFAYDYPTYVYSPVYAYPDMRYSIYPSYYLAR